MSETPGKVCWAEAIDLISKGAAAGNELTFRARRRRDGYFENDVALVIDTSALSHSPGAPLFSEGNSTPPVV